MLIRFGLAIIITLFGISNTVAFEIVDTYCNDQAKQGEWMLGIKDKKEIKYINKEFDTEHYRIVSFLDKLPVKTSEKAILTGIGVKPKSAIRVTKESVRFQWEIPGKKSNLSVILHQYKGCVSQISLMSSRNMNFYSKSNILSKQP